LNEVSLASAVFFVGLVEVVSQAEIDSQVLSNANIIFNTQLYDPGKEKPKLPIPYDYVLWGKSVYYGWEAVDEAILALRDTSPMLLLPGRKCQNGRAVPIQNADFQKAVKDLVAFTDKLWATAQTRDYEKVSDLSEELNNTCANCHKVYRDVQPGGKLQSSSAGGGIAQDRCNPNTTIDPNARGL